MIKVKCDICGKEELDINTLILIKKKIDYCNNKKCIGQAIKIRKELEKEREMQENMFMSALRNKEKELMKKI